MKESVEDTEDSLGKDTNKIRDLYIVWPRLTLPGCFDI